MEPSRNCPFCGKSITTAEYTALRERIRKAEDPAIIQEFEGVRQALTKDIRESLDSEYAPLRAKLAVYASNEKSVNERSAKVDLKEQAIDAEVAKRLSEGQAAIKASVEGQIRSELQFSFRQKDAEIADLTKKISKANQDFEARVTAEIQSREPSLRAGVQQEFQQRQAGIVSKLQEYQSRELELENMRQDLELKKQAIDLEVQKRLSTKQAELVDTALKQEREMQEMKDKENERNISLLRKEVNQLQDRLNSGSPQNRGYIQQADLAKHLGELYSDDEVTEIKRGVHGADVLHKVKLRSGAIAGIILWESKRTKEFSDSWIEKLREDQREQKADFAILASQVIPKEIEYFAVKDDVVVAHLSVIEALSSIMRQHLIGLARYKMTQQQRQGKIDELFAYMTGNEFHQRVCGIAEATSNLMELSEQEIRAHNKLWGQRRKLHERLVRQTGLLYGEVSGIVGTLQPVPRLELPETSGAFEANKDTQEEDVPF